MSNSNETQQVLMGKQERIYAEFRDSSTAHALVNPTNPAITIYDPNGTTFVSSTAPTQESTGVYYYTVSVSTASSSKEGTYQAYWQGTIDGVFSTLDIPHYFEVKRTPWEVGETDDFVWSIRRLIGDTSPDNFRVSTRDIWYYIQDAINDVQAEYNMGYTLSISNTDGLSLNKALTADATALFRFKAIILILNSVLFNGLFCAGNVDIGDIRVNVTNTMRERREMLNYLQKEYQRIMYEVKMGSISGVEIDTFVAGYVQNISGVQIQVSDINLGQA